MTTLALEPVAARERVILLDILRGFALLGILLVNFGGPVGRTFPRTDAGVMHWLELLVEGSFYPLFSLLFGVGFSIMLLRSRERGAGIVHVYFRRMLALFIIGMVHTVLIWEGDVLIRYSVFGAMLMPLYRLRSRGLLIAVLLLTVFQFESGRVTTAWDAWADTPENRQTIEIDSEMRNEQAARFGNLEIRAEGGSWSESVAVRWSVFGREIHDWKPIRLLSHDIFLIFVIGLWIGSGRFLQNARQYRSGFKVVAVVGALAAIAGYVLTQLQWEGGPELERATWHASDWGVTAFYVAVIALVVTRTAGVPRVLAVFAPVGRMGLTNYLLQSVVMRILLRTSILNVAHLGATMTVVLCCAFFFLLQVPLSHWWLARFQYGPAEWLWRTLTYGSIQPMRRLRVPINLAPELPPPVY